MTHKLKTWPVYFQAVKSGDKTFEVRRNDRDFKVEDVLLLQEWSPVKKEYTGDEMTVRVTYILPGPGFGIEAGYCVLGFQNESNIGFSTN